VSNVAKSRVDDAERATQGDAKPREVSASGDVVDAALVRAIDAEVETRGAGWEAESRCSPASFRLDDMRVATASGEYMTAPPGR
jgi:hypothetical protein